MQKKLKFLRFALFSFLLSSCLSTTQVASADKQTESNSPTLLQLPVRVFLYSFESTPEMNSTMQDQDVYKLFEVANRVWAPAKIFWKLESITRSQIDSKSFPKIEGQPDRFGARNQLIKIAPSKSNTKIWTVVIIRKFPMPAGGVYLGQVKTLYYGELNPRGNHEANIFAHELGHSLRLKHTDATNNLMVAGSRTPSLATQLTPAQISEAREQAKKGEPFSPKGPWVEE
jgi:hypothetical protein